MDELIAQFDKNATEVVRVSLTEFRGRKLIDFRVYYADDEGQYKPTKKGVALNAEAYPEFKQAMLALEKILLERHLIDPDALDGASVPVEDGEQV